MPELHIPVMTEEVLYYLDCRENGVYVDATLGDGGHAEAICRRLGPEGMLVGIDWDSEALERSRERLTGCKAPVELVRGSYTEIETILESLETPRVDGILFDLGVSTLQLTDPRRGFSYRHEETLDMRMDKTLELRAADLVNTLPASDLARLIYRYGEERWAGRIASKVVERRRTEGPVTTGAGLVEIIKAAIPAAKRRTGGHPAKRTFQALRLAVNGELDNIEAVLPRAVGCLAPGGRICVIAYHSLEDRIVKRFLREKSRLCSCPSPAPCVCGGEGVLKLLTRKAVRPSDQEVSRNPRSRSARLRAAVYKAVLKERAGE